MITTVSAHATMAWNLVEAVMTCVVKDEHDNILGREQYRATVALDELPDLGSEGVDALEALGRACLLAAQQQRGARRQ